MINQVLVELADANVAVTNILTAVLAIYVAILAFKLVRRSMGYDITASNYIDRDEFAAWEERNELIEREYQNGAYEDYDNEPEIGERGQRRLQEFYQENGYQNFDLSADRGQGTYEYTQDDFDSQWQEMEREKE